MRLLLTVLEEPYRSRAVPPGSRRYFSWLFAAPVQRDPLLGAYALVAEWQALLEPRVEPAVAQLKLAWWSDELGRWDLGAPVHPITRFLNTLPRGVATDARPLQGCLEACAAQLAGVPLERGADLEPHAAALDGAPLRAAARLAGTGNAGDACIDALAAGQYLVRAMAGYGAQARAGRIPFPVDELLAAQVGNADLAAATPPPQLAAYLSQLRRRAAGHFTTAAAALAPELRPDLRHLPVLAALGLRRLNDRQYTREDRRRWGDLYAAWAAARRAAAAR